MTKNPRYRNRDPAHMMSAEEAEERATELEAQANSMPVGEAQALLLQQAHKFRTFAEMRRYLRASG